jgi:hypothetical protein
VRKFIIAAGLVGLMACGGDAKIDERETYWASELGGFFAHDRVLPDLHP